jgi:hypothetical protein
MILAAASSPSAFWFLTRGTGAVSLVLLTLTAALGVANVRRTQIAGVPRFVFDSVHRSTALLAVTFLLVHIATAILDGFASIRLLDVVIPFRSAYRPVWVGFGAVAFDLIIAITITSLLRRRLGHGAWRATHWLAYASWPVALLHGLGTGSDTKTHWMLLLTVVCVVVMLAAVIVRVDAGWPQHLAVRLSALGVAALFPLGLLARRTAGARLGCASRHAGVAAGERPHGLGRWRRVHGEQRVGEHRVSDVEPRWHHRKLVQRACRRPSEAGPARQRSDAGGHLPDRPRRALERLARPHQGAADRRGRCRDEQQPRDARTVTESRPV